MFRANVHVCVLALFRYQQVQRMFHEHQDEHLDAGGGADVIVFVELGWCPSYIFVHELLWREGCAIL